MEPVSNIQTELIGYLTVLSVPTLVYALTTEAYHYKNSPTTSLLYNVQE